MEPDAPPASVVIVYPADWDGPLVPHPSAWHLMSDDPEEALRRFSRGRPRVEVLRVI